MRKFKIPVIPPTTSKSIRFPNDIIDEVEEAIRGTGATFSAFVIEATRVALESLREDAESEDQACHKKWAGYPLPGAAAILALHRSG